LQIEYQPAPQMAQVEITVEEDEGERITRLSVKPSGTPGEAVAEDVWQLARTVPFP